jgi:hypothetical protein
MWIRKRQRVLSALFVLIFCCSTSSWGQRTPDTPSDSRHGLHATLSAAPGYYGDPRLVTLTFCLTNDSDQVLYSEEKSWTLVIDDHEVPDRGGQLWMGPRPTGGYGTVRPGGTFLFGKALPFREYFPEARDYKVCWKAAAFRSNVVVVRGVGAP